MPTEEERRRSKIFSDFPFGYLDFFHLGSFVSSVPLGGGIAFLSFMSQHRQFQMGGGGSNAGQSQFGDTTYTKIFVGGLAWETQRDTMRRYFEQFGEIQEAVVITDKNTGRSKGYGFVTFKDPDSAMRACQDPSPVIDGRRANCNLASLGARSGSSTPQHGTGRFRPIAGSATASEYHHGASTTYFHQRAQYSVPYTAAYGYSGYAQENMYPLSYYGLYGGGQFSPYYVAGGHGFYQSVYPYYNQYGQSSHSQGSYAMQYPQVVQYPYLTQQYGAQGLLSLPTSTAAATEVTGSISSSPNPSVHGKTKTYGSLFATGVSATASSGSSSQGAPVATAEQNSASQISK